MVQEILFRNLWSNLVDHPIRFLLISLRIFIC